MSGPLSRRKSSNKKDVRTARTQVNRQQRVERRNQPRRCLGGVHSLQLSVDNMDDAVGARDVRPNAPGSADPACHRPKPAAFRPQGI